MWQLLVVIMILCIVYYHWSRRRLYRLANQIKCDYIALPLIGHMHRAIGGHTAEMKLLRAFGRQALKHGGISRGWLGPLLRIVLADIDMLETVLKSCLEKDDVMKCITFLTDNGSIFAPVSIWRPRRKIVAPTFSPKNLNKFVHVFSEQSRIMVSLLKHAPKDSFSIWDYLTTYSMDSVCETTLGFKPESQLNPNQPFIKAFESSSRLASQRVFAPWLHPLAVYKMTQQYATFKKNKAVMFDFIAQMISAKRQELMERSNDESSNGNKEENIKTFLELLIEGGKLNDCELREETLVMVMAGTDTSAVGAAYTALMLSRHQDVQHKLYQELMDVLGDTERPIVADDLPQLKYLEAVIRETLRLHPPVPITSRKIEKDVTLPSGVTLVEGCGVVVHNWALHRNPKYWGPDAEEFRPERFLEHYNTRAFMAFSLGPRNCLGYQYAMMSMKTVLASLIRQYRVLPPEEDIIRDGPNITYKPIEESFEIMMKDVNKFMIRIESRKNIACINSTVTDQTI